jgi:hypothetical protein
LLESGEAFQVPADTIHRVQVGDKDASYFTINYMNIPQLTEADACDKPYKGPLWQPKQGLTIVLESNCTLDPERLAWVPYFLGGEYDFTFCILIDCVMREGNRSRQQAMANVCFFQLSCATKAETTHG